MTTETFMLSPKYPDCTVVSYIHAPSAELNLTVRGGLGVCRGGGYPVRAAGEAGPGQGT